MRFGSTGDTAEQIMHAAKEEEITRILRNYGEEPFAGKIARRIVQRRRAFPLKSTFDLRAIIEETVPGHLLNKTLSRVFQAFRIVVNSELRVLEDTLKLSLGGLAPGGRLVIIAYHSLEDRIVKNFFKENALPKYYDKHPDKDTTNDVPKFRILTPKPLIPDDEEIARNPRARSAKMRIAEKVV
jgi:16S rRNA (cytosine1402-N4)-methyltransferase